MWHCDKCGQGSLFPITTCDPCMWAELSWKHRVGILLLALLIIGPFIAYVLL